ATDVRAKGWLGVQFKSPSTVGAVLKDSPAMEAGLYAEDEVLALDGYRVDGAALVARCEEKLPGEPVKITVFRRDQLLEVPLTLASKPADGVYLSRVDNPTDAQKLAYRDWLKAEWDEPEA